MVECMMLKELRCLFNQVVEVVDQEMKKEEDTQCSMQVIHKVNSILIPIAIKSAYTD